MISERSRLEPRRPHNDDTKHPGLVSRPLEPLEEGVVVHPLARGFGSIRRQGPKSDRGIADVEARATFHVGAGEVEDEGLTESVVRRDVRGVGEVEGLVERPRQARVMFLDRVLHLGLEFDEGDEGGAGDEAEGVDGLAGGRELARDVRRERTTLHLSGKLVEGFRHGRGVRAGLLLSGVLSSRRVGRPARSLRESCQPHELERAEH